MKTFKFFHGGSQIIRVQFSEIEDYLEEKGIDVDEAFGILVDPEDPGEFVYVSDGFIRGLKEDENEDGEWHHYFRKDADGFLEAGKFKF